MKEVVIYCDGACSGNPGPGGWGALLIYNQTRKELCGGELATTNNRMELKAAIEALKALTKPCKVICYTDSQYVQRGITEWLPKWQVQNWRTAGKQPVKNKDLWQELVSMCSIHQVEWRWVKGHDGNEGNEEADRLARHGITLNSFN